ncbi:MAG: glycosyltransferase [Xanthomonadales bacterium]|nr:glycosyltransferase [Xanthomonadales bacterium]
MTQSLIDNRLPGDPAVSVILAVRNGAATLPACVASVTDQRDVELELLLVDGASEDETWAWVRAHSDVFAWAVSEPDSGIYEAWNKALAKARGRYVCFLGADDRLASPKVLSTLLSASGNTADLVSCEAVFDLADGRAARRTGGPWNWDILRRRMCVEHRGMLHRRALFERHGLFDPGYRIAGDYDFLLRCGADLAAVHVPVPLVIAGVTGVSREQRLRRLNERRRAQVTNGVQPAAVANARFLYDLARQFAHVWLNRLRRRGRG